MGVSAMLIMAMGIIAFVILYKRRVVQNLLDIERINHQKEQDLLKASLRSEELERKRIATELHDDIGATLASVKLFLFHIKTQEEQEERMQSVRSLLDQTIQKIRNISHKLQPTILDQLGLEKALSSYAHIWNQSGGVQVSYEACPEEILLQQEGDDLHIYRMVQELVTNMIGHGRANKIKIALSATPDHYLLCVAHNGTGMRQEDYEQNLNKVGSTGLKNIQNRLRLLQGEIHHFKDDTGEKNEVLLRIPKKTD